MSRSQRRAAWRLTLIFLALVEGLALMGSGRSTARTVSEDSSAVFLPVIYYPSTPAGTYFCLEYEFGLIWTSERITLYEDGSSLYEYDPPYSGTANGTWTYTPALNVVEFTGFRWQAAAYRFPNALYASKYLPQVDFEIAIYCEREQ